VTAQLPLTTQSFLDAPECNGDRYVVCFTKHDNNFTTGYHQPLENNWSYLMYFSVGQKVTLCVMINQELFISFLFHLLGKYS
jgi:hypothetical protein